MSSSEEEEVQAVAYLEVRERTSNGKEHPRRITIQMNDDFYLGRSPKHCLCHWADPSISNRHLRIHCLIWEEFADKTKQLPPLVYATDVSSNGTVLTPSHDTFPQESAPSKICLTRKTGAYLLNSGDELRLSTSVSLVYRTQTEAEEYMLDEFRERESQLFSSRYLITNRILGLGGNGTVFVAVHRNSKRQLACKVVRIKSPVDPGSAQNAPEAADPVAQSLQFTHHDFASTRGLKITKEWFDRLIKHTREFDILKDLRHPNIVKIEKVFWSTHRIYIFQELIPGGDLHSYILAKGRLSDPEAAVITRQILKAVEYMHGRGIVHRDLKLENILMTSLDESARIVVTDFGGARRIPPLSGDREDPTDVRSRRMFSAMGTLDFAAPEVFRVNKTMPKNHGYSRCVDMWSIGCIAAALLAGSPPFASGKHDDKHSILRLMSRCDLEFMNTNKTWKLVGQRSKDFIRKLLILEEDKRMTATQALAHPWFTNEHHAAAFKALYENAVRDWQPPRKVFKMVERLIPNVTSDLGENGLPKPFLPSAIVSRYFNAPSGSNNQTSTNSLTISQGKRANTPLPTITEEYEMEQYRYSHPARSMHSSVYASMNQLNIPPNEDAPDGTLQHGSESVEQYTYLDIDHTDLNYDRQEQIYESYPESPPDAAIPESVPETPARGVKRRVTSFRAGDFDETDFDSQRSNGSEGFMTAKTFAGEVAKRRRVD